MSDTITNTRWLSDLQWKSDEYNARLALLFERHPRWQGESNIEHMARLVTVKMRDVFPLPQLQLFADHQQGGVYAYQRKTVL